MEIAELRLLAGSVSEMWAETQWRDLSTWRESTHSRRPVELRLLAGESMTEMWAETQWRDFSTWRESTHSRRAGAHAVLQFSTVLAHSHISKCLSFVYCE